VILQIPTHFDNVEIFLFASLTMHMGNPVRKIKSRTRGVRGYFFSLKNSRRVDYESLNEQSLMKVLETDPHITSYLEQPLRLDFEWKGRTYTYTPDLLSTDVFSNSILYEVKPEEALKKDDGRLAVKFEAAKEYCSEHGWAFKVVTDSIRKSLEYQRADFLWPHLMNPQVDEDLVESIFENVRGSGTLRFSDIIEKTNWNNPSYCTLLHLIGKGVLIESSRGSFELNSEVEVFTPRDT